MSTNKQTIYIYILCQKVVLIGGIKARHVFILFSSIALKK
jgi:hypothetical protein